MKRLSVVFALLCLFITGCSNFHVKPVYQPINYYEEGKLPIASQQSLISSAAEHAFNNMDFSSLKGKRGYIEVTGVYNDALLTNYLAAKCEERLAVGGVAILPQKLKIFEPKSSDKVELKDSSYSEDNKPVLFIKSQKVLQKNRHRGIYSPVFNYYIEPENADYKFQVIVETAGINIKKDHSRLNFWVDYSITYSSIVNITVVAVPLKPGLKGAVQKGSAQGDRIVEHYYKCVIPVIGQLINLFRYTDNDAPFTINPILK